MASQIANKTSFKANSQGLDEWGRQIIIKIVGTPVCSVFFSDPGGGQMNEDRQTSDGKSP